MATSASFVIGGAFSGTLVGVLAATDEDVGTTLSFRLVGGDPGGAFSLSPSGQLFVRDAEQFGATSTYFLVIEVSVPVGLL